jgi:non-heme chloroperoxidase
MHSHWIEGGDGVRLHVREAGRAEGPPLLFIHGFSFSHLAWRRQLEGPLADEFRLLALDLRGHGMSGRPDGHAAYGDGRLWAEDVASVIAALRLERPVLVPWSYGGLVVGDYLRHFGDAALGGLMMVATVVAQGQTRPPPGPDSASPWFSADHAVMVPAMRSFAGHCAVRLSAEDHAEFTAITALTPPHVRLGLLMRREDYVPAYAATRRPVRMVWGDKDVLVPRREIDLATGAMPRAEVLVYDGVGHMPFHEAPERFAADLATFARDASA